MKFTRYHKEIYFPKSWGAYVEQFLQGFSTVFESRHYAEQSMGRRMLSVKKEDLKAADVFELAFNENGELQKAAFRVKHLHSADDMVVVIAWNGCIVTAWRNSKTDNHKTLDKSLYAVK